MVMSHLIPEMPVSKKKKKEETLLSFSKSEQEGRWRIILKVARTEKVIGALLTHMTFGPITAGGGVEVEKINILYEGPEQRPPKEPE